jgi:hypothetical protein
MPLASLEVDVGSMLQTSTLQLMCPAGCYAARASQPSALADNDQLGQVHE